MLFVLQDVWLLTSTYHFEYVLELLGVVLEHATSVNELQKRMYS